MRDSLWGIAPSGIRSRGKHRANYEIVPMRPFQPAKVYPKTRKSRSNSRNCSAEKSQI